MHSITAGLGSYGSGIDIVQTNPTVVNALAFNNQSAGVRVFQANSGSCGANPNTATNATLVNIASLHNGTVNVNDCGAQGTTMVGNLVVGNGGLGDCRAVNTIGCEQAPFLAVSRRDNVSLATSLRGEVVDNDLANLSDTNGLAQYADIQPADWVRFDSPFRFWGSAAYALTDARARLGCNTGAQCRIQDVRLNALDGVVRNMTDMTFGGTSWTGNGPFSPGDTCPPAVHGNKTTTVLRFTATPVTFLTNATEIIGDYVGDDNGLCESNERCLYAPNFGAYQGDGDYLAQGTCTFQDGTVTGVKMYAYPINGLAP